jgi:hypothetical protein
MNEIDTRHRLPIVGRMLRLTLIGLVAVATATACISADGLLAPPDCEDDVLVPPDTITQPDSVRPPPPTNPAPDVTPCGPGER